MQTKKAIDLWKAADLAAQIELSLEPDQLKFFQDGMRSGFLRVPLESFIRLKMEEARLELMHHPPDPDNKDTNGKAFAAMNVESDD